MLASRSTTALLLLLLSLLPAAPGLGLVVDVEDPAANERAPEPDPGWDHVGKLAMVSAIYLGEGWMLTASHTPIGDVEIGGVRYPAVPESRVWLDMPGRTGTKSDVALFRVDPAPNLPALAIAEEPPTRGSLVLMLGLGLSRGAPVGGDPPNGYSWQPRRVKRWGTNRVSEAGVDLSGPRTNVTRCFRMDFSRYGTEHEAQAAAGDSGGAVFVKDRDSWRLAGVMLSIGRDANQPDKISLYGNYTNAADLSAYAAQIRRAMRGTGTTK